MKEEYLNNLPLFAHFSSKERRAVAKYLRLEEYKENEVIFVVNGDSDALYIVQEGWVSLSSNEATTLANLGPGSLLGEADFLQGIARTMTARATADTSVWVLDNTILETILDDNPQIGLNLSLGYGHAISQMASYLVQRLAEVPSMQGLSVKDRSLIASRLKARKFEADNAIFRSGDPAAGLFLIEGGLVRLIGDNSQDYTELHPGQVFGEMEVLSGKAHGNTAQVAQTTIAWQLTLEDFNDITSGDPEIRTTLSRTLTARLSYADQGLAADVLKKIPLFAELSREALEDVAAHLMLRHVPAGQIVYGLNDPGDAMYVVESGQMEVQNDRGELVARPGEGEYFGEMALLTGKSRTHTATAVHHTNLWAMYRPDFDDSLVKYPQLSVALSRMLKENLSAVQGQFVEKHLKKIAVMGGLSRLQLDDISSRLRARHYNGGDIIIQEGQTGQELFFIENGHIERTTLTPAGYIKLPTLETGDFFGETALLSNRPHNSTVRALSTVDVWTLDKANFDDLVYKYPNLSAVLNRIMSDRLVETMEILRSGRATQAPAAQVGPGSGHVHSRPTTAVPPVYGRSSGAPPNYQTGPQAPTGGWQAQPHPQSQSMGSYVPSWSQPTGPMAPQPRQSSRPYSQPASQPQPRRQRRASGGSRRQSRRSRAQQAGVSRNISRGAGRATSRFRITIDNLSEWYASIPVGTRVGLFILTLLLVWICGIVGPFSIIQALAATLKLNDAEQLNAEQPPSDFNVVGSLSQSGLVAALPFMETATPTPTGTLTPSATPIAPATVTQTPISTFTPTPTYTPTPEDTPTPTPTPTDTPIPTATPVPPTNTPDRPAVPTDTPTPAPTATPDVDFLVAKVRKLTPCENQGKHHIFIRVVDANGTGLNNIPVKISWGPNSNDNILTKTEPKDKGDGFIEYAMFKGTYSVEIVGAKTQVASGITPDFQVDEPCTENGNAVGNSLFHASFEVIFQRTF